MRTPARRRPRWPVRFAALALFGVTLGGCDVFDNLLSVRTPTQVLATELDDPRQATFLSNSMVAIFYCAYGAYIQGATEVSDVLFGTANNVIRAYYDARQLDSGLGHVSTHGPGLCDPANGTSMGVYRPLQEARWFADDLLEKLSTWPQNEIVGNLDELTANAAAHSGYATLVLGEGFCSAAFDGGPELTRAQTFQRAVDRFDQAIAAGTTAGSASLVNMARVGKARALQNLGDLPGAAAVARQVPAGFVRESTHEAAPNSRKNIVAWQTVELQNGSVREAFRSFEWQGVPDPRVQVINQTAPRNTWVQQKYPMLTTPIPIATYEEARLIIAEAEHAAGNYAEVVAIINELHAAVGLSPFQSADPQEIWDHLMKERVVELFMEGHRLGDMLRYNIPFTPAAGTPYEGVGGGSYGPTTCMPLPPVEYQNNPNINR